MLYSPWIEPMVRACDAQPSVLFDFYSRLNAWPSPPVSVLEGDLDSPDALTRSCAAIGLACVGRGYLDNDRVIDALVAAIDPHKYPLSFMALYVMMTGTSARIRQIHLTALSNPDGMIRNLAVTYCTRYAIAKAIKPMIALVNDTYLTVAKSAVEGIGRMKAAEGIDALIGALGRSEPIRSAAAVSLGNFDEPRVVEALLAHLNGASPPLRMGILASLHRLTLTSEQHELLEKAKP